MKWAKLEKSRSQIIRAGKVIKSNIDTTSPEFKSAIKIIDNFRAAHAYPLQVFYMYFKRNSRSDCIVAQRLKRLNSITGKLKREKTMNLWTMQDIGGCRIIVPSISNVYELIGKYKKSRARHFNIEDYDYIQNPKISGYRSYHMVYKFFSETNTNFNRNILIEIQVRTKLQHLWSTALETYDLVTKQGLKSSIGDEATLDFFRLVSSCFAIEENCNIIPSTPNNINEIRERLIDIDKKHNILYKLRGIRSASEHLKKNIEKAKGGYYLLLLNLENYTLKIHHYPQSEIERVMNIYSKIENSKSSKKIDAVLATVSSFSVLKSAYPNYFSDINEFISKVENIISQPK